MTTYVPARVSVQHPHTKLINAAAREILRPLGVVQKGRSRTWLDDRGWWLTMVEFQASSWSRGSYLNVGVHWIWSHENDLTFDYAIPSDIGSFRVSIPGTHHWVEYESDQQFAPFARKLATLASDRVLTYRDLIGSVDDAATVLTGKDAPAGESADIDAGIALGLLGRVGSAQKRFAAWLRFFADHKRASPDSTGRDERHRRVLLLSDLVSDHDRFRQRIREDIRAARAGLGLNAELRLPF